MTRKQRQQHRNRLEVMKALPAYVATLITIAIVIYAMGQGATL